MSARRGLEGRADALLRRHVRSPALLRKNGAPAPHKATCRMIVLTVSGDTVPPSRPRANAVFVYRSTPLFPPLARGDEREVPLRAFGKSFSRMLTQRPTESSRGGGNHPAGGRFLTTRCLFPRFSWFRRTLDGLGLVRGSGRTKRSVCGAEFRSPRVGAEVCFAAGLDRRPWATRISSAAGWGEGAVTTYPVAASAIVTPHAKNARFLFIIDFSGYMVEP